MEGIILQLVLAAARGAGVRLGEYLIGLLAKVHPADAAQLKEGFRHIVEHQDRWERVQLPTGAPGALASWSEPAPEPEKP
jgi:hypothetical protein